MATKNSPRESQEARSSDESKFNQGIREFNGKDAEDGKFNEAEERSMHMRRDPEESKYNEAGQQVITQGDFEMSKLNQPAKSPEGSKISNSVSQESL